MHKSNSLRTDGCSVLRSHALSLYARFSPCRLCPPNDYQKERKKELLIILIVFSLFLSLIICLTFLIDLSAYIFLVAFSSTSMTFPNAPLPSTFSN